MFFINHIQSCEAAQCLEHLQRLLSKTNVTSECTESMVSAKLAYGSSSVAGILGSVSSMVVEPSGAAAFALALALVLVLVLVLRHLRRGFLAPSICYRVTRSNPSPVLFTHIVPQNAPLDHELRQTGLVLSTRDRRAGRSYCSGGRKRWKGRLARLPRGCQEHGAHPREG